MRVLLLADAGRQRDELQAILTSFADVELAVAIRGEAVALATLDAWQPELVILSLAAPAGSTEALVRAIKHRRAGTRCMVLVNRLDEMPAMLQAGADRAWLKDLTTTTLFREMEQMSPCMTRPQAGAF